MKFVIDTQTKDVFAVGYNDFQKTYVCDIYNRNGQRISHDDAGSYLILWSDKAVNLMNTLDNQLGGEEWSMGDYVYAYDYHGLFWDFMENQDYVEGVDYIFDCEQVEALTVHYADKSVSVVINCTEFATSIEWVSRDEAEYFAELIRDNNTEDYWIDKSTNGEWWDYRLTEK